MGPTDFYLTGRGLKKRKKNPTNKSPKTNVKGGPTTPSSRSLNTPPTEMGRKIEGGASSAR